MKLQIIMVVLVVKLWWELSSNYNFAATAAYLYNFRAKCVCAKSNIGFLALSLCVLPKLCKLRLIKWIHIHYSHKINKLIIITSLDLLDELVYIRNSK